MHTGILSRFILSSASRGDVKTGDHHEMGLAEVDTVFQTLSHTFQGLQVFQRIQIEYLLQINCGEENRQIGNTDKTQCWLLGQAFKYSNPSVPYATSSLACCGHRKLPFLFMGYKNGTVAG